MIYNGQELCGDSKLWRFMKGEIVKGVQLSSSEIFFTTKFKKQLKFPYKISDQKKRGDEFTKNN